MVARDPARPKAAHIPDLEFLSACRAYSDRKANHPIEVFTAKYPGKVVMEKVAKLRRRGLVLPNWHLTVEGLNVLAMAGERGRSVIHLSHVFVEHPKGADRCWAEAGREIETGLILRCCMSRAAHPVAPLSIGHVITRPDIPVDGLSRFST